jgi:uncharacterized protein YihD (DUF1040 family)
LSRDPNRIPQVLEVLRGVWERNPDLRLGQLISNVCPNDKDLYFVEDDVWEDRLWRLLAESHTP